MADPVRLITNGTAGIGLSSSGEFSRENSRTFIVSETFLHLLQVGTSVPKSCDVGMLANENFAYPVTGSIGMHEMISTFIDLNQEEALTPSSGSSSTSTKGASATSSKAPAMSTSGSGVFADTMNFNTTLMGGVTPSVQINPIGNKWGLSSPTNFGATVTRSDKHMLIVGLSLETSSTRIPLVSTTFLVPMSGSQARSALQKNRPISPAEQRALDAVQQQRLDTFLNRFGTVVP